MAPRKEQRRGMRGRARRAKSLGEADPRSHRDPQATYRGDTYREPLYVGEDGLLALRLDDTTTPPLEVGPDGLRFVETPAAAFPTTAYAVDVGNGSATSIDVVHSLSTRDVSVSLYLATSTYDAVLTDWQHKDTSTITLLFASAPSSSQYRCVVQKG